ncbi:hypothetical protein PENTCL1PPCAC_17890, partial [Pristionchus entomophagus]
MSIQKSRLYKTEERPGLRIDSIRDSGPSIMQGSNKRSRTVSESAVRSSPIAINQPKAYHEYPILVESFVSFRLSTLISLSFKSSPSS